MTRQALSWQRGTTERELQALRATILAIRERAQREIPVLRWMRRQAVRTATVAAQTVCAELESLEAMLAEDPDTIVRDILAFREMPFQRGNEANHRMKRVMEMRDDD